MLSIRSILHPTDYSSEAKAALKHAGFLTRVLKADLHVLHAIPSPGACTIVELPATIPPDASYLQGSTARSLQTLLAATAMGNRPVRCFLAQGASPSSAILEHMRSNAVNLIVLGTHGHRHRSPAFLGSVAIDVMRRATCPVLFVHGPQEEIPDAEVLGRLLVYIDVETGTSGLVPLARDLATLYRADLEVLYVAESSLRPPNRRRDIESMEPDLETAPARSTEQDRTPQRPAEGMAPSFTPRVRVHHRTGYPPDVIVQFARTYPPDLLVMAAPRLTSTTYARSETMAEHIVSRAPCPVYTFGYPTSLKHIATQRTDSRTGLAHV